MFTGKLALRYLKEQKRHSVLTICSITAAVTFITMLLILVSSAIETFYNYRYIQTPYHVSINIDIQKDEYNGYIENFIQRRRTRSGLSLLLLRKASPDRCEICA